jgi:hypothetical protein
MQEGAPLKKTEVVQILPSRSKTVAIPESSLARPASPTELFQPTLMPGVTQKLENAKEIAPWVPALGALVVAGGDLGTSIAMFPNNPPPLIAIQAFASLAILPLAAGLIGRAAVVPRIKRKVAALDDYSRKLASRWVRERYGVEVAPEAFIGAEAMLNNGPNHEQSFTFQDASGRFFQLLEAGNGGLQVEEVKPKPKQLDYAPAGSVASIVPAGSSDVEERSVDSELLTGEVASLYAKTHELLSALGSRHLNAEGSHVVSRVRADIVQALSINRELLAVGPLDAEDEAALASVLSALNGELQTVLSAERATLKAALQTQVAYLKERGFSLQQNSHLLLTDGSEQVATISGELAGSELS